MSEPREKSVIVSEKEIPLIKNNSKKSSNSSCKSPKKHNESIVRDKTNTKINSKESNCTIKTPIQSSNASRNIRNRSSTKNNLESNQNSINRNSASNSVKLNNKIDKYTSVN